MKLVQYTYRMSRQDQRYGFTPEFVNLMLTGVNYRFLLIMECESRPPTDGSPPINHARFCVGGKRATYDPRNLAITELEALDPTQIEIPTGWEKVHQLIYGKCRCCNSCSYYK